MVASFDIFDTLLTRSVGNPKAVFLLLGRYLNRKGVLAYEPQYFAYARTVAQRLALSKASGKDVTLNQIYEELAFSLNIDPETCERIKEKELEIESLVLKEVPGAKSVIRKEMDAGKKILFISDMYLPSGFIIDQLKKNGYEVDNNCYVSNEYLKTKHTGELFRHVHNELKLPPSNFYHFGDNETADFTVPRKLKWNAIHYKDIHANRFEKILNWNTSQTDGMAAALSGASRYSRLAVHATGSKKIIKEIAAGVVSPILTGFLLWLFKRARSLGIRKIYFLSRDGQIFHKMSTILATRLHLDLELSYLYSSRKTWQFAALTDITEDDVNSWILNKKARLTIEMVFARVFLNVEDFQALLAGSGFKKEEWSKDLSQEEINTLHHLIEKSELKDAILQAALKQRELLLTYLGQEGLTDGAAYAIVDIGWVGNSQNYLAKILQNQDVPKPTGFYLALRDNVPNESYGLKEGYFVNQLQRVGYYLSLRKLGSLLESFCHADHGSLRQYTIKDGKVVPELETEVNEKVVTWGLPLIHETACCFCEQLLIHEDLIDPYVDVRAALVKVLKALGDTPQVDEAKVWGSLELECNTNETKWNPLSQSYSLKEIIYSLWKGKVYRDHYSWEEGSLVLTSKPYRVALQYAIKAGLLARKIIRKK